ncbi:TPA: Wzy polymerase domain-containing protein [Photobacterium damselae]
MNKIINKDNIKNIFLITYGSLFVLFMHYFQPNPGGQGIHIPFNATSWIAIGFVVSIGIFNVIISKKIRYSKMTNILFIICILLTIPILYWNANIYKSINRIITLWSGFLLFLSFQQFEFNNKERFSLLWFIFLGSFIEILYSWVQFKFLSFDNFFGYDTIVNRPYGIFQQPNVMASFAATGLAISGYLLTLLPKKLGCKHIIIIIAPVLFIPIITVLNSRTGWVCTIISVLLLLPFCFFHVKSRGFFIAWMGSLILGFALNTSSVVNESWNGVDNKFNLQSPRLIHIPQAFNMLLEKPMFGYGYGNFDTAYIEQTAEWHDLDIKKPSGIPRLAHPHNEILYWGVEGGVVPLIAIFLFAISLIKSLIRFNIIRIFALLSLFFPILFHAMVEYPFYHSIIHLVIFIILIYFVDSFNKYSFRQKDIKYFRLIKLFNITYPSCIAIYMLSSLYSGAQLYDFESSRPYNTKYLDNVINKAAWKNRYEWDLNINNLRIGMKNKDYELISNYIIWAKQMIYSWPEPELYESLIDAYIALGNINDASIIKERAFFLFPDMNFNK